MNKNTIDFVAIHANRFNLDNLIETITGYDPIDFKKQIIRLYMFASNAAIHSDYVSEEDIEAIDLLQQIAKSLEDVERHQDSLLAIRVK